MYIIHKIKRSLKEWNAVIEALGHGEQFIIIRKYLPTTDEFFLYPTFTYARDDNYLEKFKKNYWEFVEKFAYPQRKNNKTEVKYYAKIKKVITIPSIKLKKINKYHIWNLKHIKEYLKNKNANVWLLSVYKLEKPLMLDFNRSMLYTKLKRPINVDFAQPILDKKTYLKLEKEILEI